MPYSLKNVASTLSLKVLYWFFFLDLYLYAEKEGWSVLFTTLISFIQITVSFVYVLKKVCIWMLEHIFLQHCVLFLSKVKIHVLETMLAPPAGRLWNQTAMVACQAQVKAHLWNGFISLSIRSLLNSLRISPVPQKPRFDVHNKINKQAKQKGSGKPLEPLRQFYCSATTCRWKRTIRQ